MNIKTYSFVKFLATIGSVFLFTVPLLGFLQETKKLFSNSEMYLPTIITLLVIGSVFLISYIMLRLFLITKSSYTYVKKDKINLFLSIVSYLFGIVLVIIFTILLFSLNSDAIKISFYIIYPFVFLAMICGAIFETLSRIDEQIKLYQDQEKSNRSNKSDLQNSNINESNNEMISKRTKQAEELLNKRKDSYNPFMDEKLNQELEDENKKD